MNFLYVAYLATWIIHLGYIFGMSRRAARLRRQWDDLRRDKAGRGC